MLHVLANVNDPVYGKPAPLIRRQATEVVSFGLETDRLPSANLKFTRADSESSVVSFRGDESAPLNPPESKQPVVVNPYINAVNYPEELSCYLPSIGRADAEDKLRSQGNGCYLVRACGDQAEFIDGKPNPNLFVVSFRDADKFVSFSLIAPLDHMRLLLAHSSFPSVM